MERNQENQKIKIMICDKEDEIIREIFESPFEFVIDIKLDWKHQ